MRKAALRLPGLDNAWVTEIPMRPRPRNIRARARVVRGWCEGWCEGFEPGVKSRAS